jgi:hypothetical protein
MSDDEADDAVGAMMTAMPAQIVTLTTFVGLLVGTLRITGSLPDPLLDQVLEATENLLPDEFAEPGGQVLELIQDVAARVEPEGGDTQDG